MSVRLKIATICFAALSREDGALKTATDDLVADFDRLFALGEQETKALIHMTGERDRLRAENAELREERDRLIIETQDLAHKEAGYGALQPGNVKARFIEGQTLGGEPMFGWNQPKRAKEGESDATTARAADDGRHQEDPGRADCGAAGGALPPPAERS